MRPTNQRQPSPATDAPLYRFVSTNRLKKALFVLIAAAALTVPIWLASATSTNVERKLRLTAPPVFPHSNTKRNLNSAPVAATIYVDDGWVGTPANTDPDNTGPATNFGVDSFATIQGAVNAASPGDTVFVYAGNYTEQVTISKNLTLTGENTATTVLHTPATLSPRIGGTLTLVQVDTSAVVNLSGLTISGPHATANGCADPVYYGIFVVGGANLNLHDAAVTNIQLTPASLHGCQTGIAIRGGSLALGQTATLTVNNMAISGYQKSAIIVDNTGSSGTITNNTITGLGPENIGANAIQIGRGAGATITGNNITANECSASVCGPNPLTQTTSTGVLIFQTSATLLIDNNTISTNDTGIYNNGDNTTISGNTMVGNRYNGIFQDKGTSSITGNTLTGPMNVGFLAASFNGNTGNSTATLTGNTIVGATTGLQLIDETNADAFVPQLTAHFNRIVSGTTAIDNPNNQTASLENNWWGCNNGPSGLGCGAVTGSNAVFSPWFVVSAQAIPNSMTPGGTSNVSVDLTRNSNNVVPASTIPSTPVSYNATNGDMTPPTGTITSGAANSQFTSTNANSANVTVTVDNQNLNLPITVTAPSFSISDETHPEGNPPGTTSYVFTVTKTGGTALSSSVNFTTQDGTATLADNDYTLQSGTLTFSPTDTTMQITVQVNHDFKVETNEAFTVHLSGAVGATISDADGTGTIQNDDNQPSVVYVDDDFTGAIGSDPDGAGPATAIGYDAFKTIQEGVNGVTAGGTVIVFAGTYAEQPGINKAVSVLGPNATINPNTGVRVPEARIIPTSSDPLNAGFGGPISVYLQVPGITFKGFTVDGDNPSLTSGVIFNGADVDAEFGIYGDGAGDLNAVVENNIVQNVGEFGIWLDSFGFGGTRNGNTHINQNKVDNILGAFGQGIRIADDCWADVTNNVVNRVRSGIVIENYSGNVTTHPASIIDHNQVTSFRIGIRHNLHYVYSAPGFTISQNTVQPYVQSPMPSQVTTPTSYQGIRVESIQQTVAVTVQDNVLIGNKTAMQSGGYTRNEGLNVTNASATSPNILFNHNDVRDFIRGAFHETPAVPDFECNLFTGNTTAFQIDAAASNGLIAHQNNILANGAGMQNNSAATVNATNNYWGRPTGPTAAGNPGGTGDTASTNVTFSPFLTAHASCAPVVSYTITASAGANGSISPSGAVSVASGESQTFSITPDPHYHTVDVVVDGSSVGAVSGYTFTDVLANHTISASFAITTHTITASAGANGSITPSGAVIVNDGADQLFNLTPASGFHVQDVLVDSVSVGAVTSHTITNVTADHTISATFAITCGTPNPVYVDRSWAGTTLGTDPDGAGPATSFGCDSFATIQEGVDAVAANGTVNVFAGNYPENVTVPKSLSLLGPNATINPNTGARVPEAVVRPAVTQTSLQGGSTSGTIFRLGTGAGHINVTLKGFTLDGNNPTLTGGRTLNGIEIHTGAAIVNSVGSFDSNPGAFDTTMVVQNNIIQNLERYGVLADNVPARTPSAGNDVSFNKIDNLPSGNNFGGGRGRGIAFEENVYGSATFNVMTRVNVGWQNDNYNLASPGSGTLIDHNQIHTYHRGIFHNLQYQDATAATITNNQIFAETSGDFPASTTNFGLELSSIQSAVGVTVTGNSSTGNVYGILLWNLPTTNTITVSGGTLSGNQYGVLATSNDPQFGAGAASQVTVSGVTVNGATVAGAAVQDTVAATTLTVSNANISAGTGVGMLADGAGNSINVTGSTITGCAKGVVIRNGAVGNSITGNSIHDNTGLGIDLGDDGVTPNDPSDTDSGANNLQNFPIIATALVGTPNTISGTLNSAPGQAFTIHLYANPACDASGNGEGQTLIGSTTANTNGSGDAVWALNPGSLTAGDFITATATDASGNTSEFSACFQARAFTPGTITFNQVSNSETNANHDVNLVVSRTGGSDGAVSVQYSVNDGSALVADNDYSVAAPTGTFTWANGDASDRFITINVKGDNKFEANETVLLSLSNPTGGAATGGTNPALTITNDDAPPSFSIDDVTHNEGDAGTTAYVFTITKTGNTALDAGVNFQTADNTATAGTDYQSQTGTLTFLPSDTTKTVTVLVNGDTTIEPDETFSLNLSGASNATISDSQGVGTITNDDMGVSVAVSPSSVLEDGATNLVYTFTRAGNTTSALTANFTVGGTAAFNSDYTQSGAAAFNSSSGTVTFAAGSSTATVTIDPTTDVTVEPDETVILTVTTGTGYNVATPSAATGTITNDDTDVTLSVSPASVSEDGVPNLVYTFTRNGNTTAALTANFSVAGTATLSTDYAQSGAASFNSTSGTVTFAAGSTTATVTIDPTTDSTVEPDETVILTVTAGTGYGIGAPSAASGTITNDDTDVSMAVSPSSVLEDGATNLVYTFTRNGMTAGPLTVNFSVAGTATFGTDYAQSGAASFNSTSGAVTFAAGSSTATVIVDPTADSSVEPDETVVLTVAAGAGYNIVSPGAATGTITNDDTDVTLSVSPASVTEDGATNLVYTFTRNGNATGSLTVNFSVAGTATLGSDYTQSGAASFNATSGTVNFAAGSTTATVTVDPTTDSTAEPDETVILTVTSGTGYNVATPSAATGTITNDDTDVSVAVSPETVPEDGSTNLVYTFTRHGNTTAALTANFTVTGTATLNSDYTQSGAATFSATNGTVIFAAGNSTATVTIDPTLDSVVEPDETVILTVASGSGYGVGSPNAATGTIFNDDAPPLFTGTTVSVAVSPSTVPEDGATNLVYTFTRNGDPTAALTVNFSVAGTATFNSDYTQSGAATFSTTNGTVTFAAGALTATVTIDPTADNVVEPDETAILTLTSGTDYSVASPSAATGTIVNDDGNIGGRLQFSAASYNTTEGSFFALITVRRLGDTTGAVSVDYATPDDSAATIAVPCETISGVASPRCDFTTAVGTLQWASGDSAPKSFIVLISEDDYVEASEALTLTLSNPTGGATLGSPSTAILTIADDPNQPTTNPIDDPSDFVRQHYHDFLNREPDASGFAFWVGNFPPCGADPQCIEVKRINVSAAFYLSIEFQGTGFFVERLYKTSYGDAIGTSNDGGPHQVAVPIVKFSEFLPDTQEIGRGVVVGADGWEAALEAKKVAFAQQFVQRTRFLNAYPLSMTPAQFVDALNASAGNPLSTAERDQLVSDLTGGAKTRAQVLRAVADDQDLVNAEFNRGFVLMQYFGFLRRNPNAAPDVDHSGYDFWLKKLNSFNGNFINAEMVKAFLSSTEYRHRAGVN